MADAPAVGMALQDHRFGSQPVDGAAIELTARATLGQDPGDVALDPCAPAGDLGSGGGSISHVRREMMAGVFLTGPFSAAFLKDHHVLGQQQQDRPGMDAILRLGYVKQHVERYAAHVMALGAPGSEPAALGLAKLAADNARCGF